MMSLICNNIFVSEARSKWFLKIIEYVGNSNFQWEIRWKGDKIVLLKILVHQLNMKQVNSVIKYIFRLILDTIILFFLMFPRVTYLAKTDNIYLNEIHDMRVMK